MAQSVSVVVMWSALAGQYVLAFLFVTSLLRVLTVRRPRFMHLAAFRWQQKRVPDNWLRMLRMSRMDPSFKERERLLAGCGFAGDAAVYMFFRRLFLVFVPLWSAGIYGMSLLPIILLPSYAPPLLLAAAVLLLLWDRPWAGSFPKDKNGANDEGNIHRQQSASLFGRLIAPYTYEADAMLAVYKNDAR
ncbi:hypothetical protein ACFPYJ_10995 [Paenibacillus solisilvae]|uniref:Uncharacterized protein n=1 Tax=Paenibacillus solisilvae TaxID=2486751 RepID=A0ABW0VXB1_9BACL